MYFHELPQQEQDRVRAYGAWLAAELPLRCAADGMVMCGAVLDVLLCGSFVNGYAEIEGYARSDYDIALVLAAHGQMTYLVHPEGFSPHTLGDDTQARMRTKRLFSTLTGVTPAELASPLCAYNTSIRGWDMLYMPAHVTTLGISLLTGQEFSTPQAFAAHHGMSHA